MTTKAINTENLLFELGCEELPPKNLAFLAESFARLFVNGLQDAGLSLSAYKVFATPRRLAVLVENLSSAQEDQLIVRKGPALKAAFDKDGKPTKAALGFAKSNNATIADLQKVESDKGAWLVFKKTQKGKNCSEVLPDIAAAALNQLPIAKRMNWGNHKTPFVRPVHWILFLYGSEIVKCKLLGLSSDRLTYGHRFHKPLALEIEKAGDYENKLLEQAYVIADFSQRKAIIKEQAESVVKKTNGSVQINQNLLNEVTALVEWPRALLGNFDIDFLSVPQEALISSMQEHQKYFPITDEEGKLLPHFITISNIDSVDPQQIVSGNEKVIRPRLADAKFFFETDKKQTLYHRSNKLENIIFQAQLGSLLEKSIRISKIARLISAKIDGNEEFAHRAGLLSKADLNSEMVGEFPDLQGIMGKYYAEHDKEAPEVSQALEEQYWPRFAGDKLPDSLTGCALAIADRLDTIVGIFGIGQIPTGDKDPFGLRRASLGVLRIIIEKKFNLDLVDLVDSCILQYDGNLTNKDTQQQALHFIQGRYRAFYQEKGISTKVIISVENRQPTRPFDFDCRVQAVNRFIELPEASSLCAANKRVKNILAKQDLVSSDKPVIIMDLLHHETELALAQQVQKLSNSLFNLADKGLYTEALTELSSLHSTVDNFFNEVMVMDENFDIRKNRLNLLAKLHNLFLHIADISELAG